MLGLLAGAAIARPAQGAAVPSNLLFQVSRKGMPIGMSRARFTPVAGGFEVAQEIELAVKLAFVTVYRYHQVAEERWLDGLLAASDIHTEDDGERTRVTVEREADELKVTGPGLAYRLALGHMTDAAFWNIRSMEQERLVDSQHGDLMSIRVAPPVQDVIEVAGQMLPTVRHTITASPSRKGTPREGTVWYDMTGRSVRSEILTRGELLVMTLQA